MANVEGELDNRSSKGSKNEDNLGSTTSAFAILLADTNNIKE